MFPDIPMSPVNSDKVELRRYKKTDDGTIFYEFLFVDLFVFFRN